MKRPRWMLPLLAALVALGVGAARPAAAEEPVIPRLTVRGQGVVGVRPDLAVVTMGANVRRESADAAFSRASELTNALFEALRAQGVAERDIATRQVTMAAEFGRAPEGGGPAPIVAWRATNLLTIRIRNLSQIGTVLDTGARILGNDGQISGIGFTIEDTDAAAAQARAQAIANARERAQAMAAAAGVRLVRILSITETSAPAPTPVALAAPAPAGVAAARAPEIAPGEQNITVSVEIVWEIG